MTFFTIYIFIGFLLICPLLFNNKLGKVTSEIFDDDEYPAPSSDYIMIFIALILVLITWPTIFIGKSK